MTLAAGEPRLAIFSTATESYLPYTVTCLRSFQRHNAGREFGYFVLGSGYSHASCSLLRRHGVEYLDLDLSDIFRQRPEDRYPSECFWHFKAPEVFAPLGYSHSLQVDGDTWCNRRLDLEWLPRVEHLAGIRRGASVRRFLGSAQYSRLAEIFTLAPGAGDRPATNTGVLFYNNPAAVEIGLFDKLVEVYRRSEEGGVRRRGDDSTLALLLAVHGEIRLHPLSHMWNAYRGLYRRFPPSDPRHRSHLAAWLDRARIVHLYRSKPWQVRSSPPNRVHQHFVQGWRQLHAQTIPRRPRWNGKGRPDAGVRAYWYRGRRPNFGDEIAPYLVKQLLGLPLDATLPPPRDPSGIPGPVLLSVGSVLRLAGPNTVVWGSGIRDYHQSVRPARRFCAVRGPLTRRRLRELGYRCPPVYGDPALLLPRFYQPRPVQRRVLGIIPHLVDYTHLRRLYGRHPDVRVVNLASTDVERVVDEIAGCAATVSSSLHGVVVSVAYGIPTRWLRFSDRVKGDDTKFYDFFASLEPEVAERLDPATLSLPADEPSLEPFRPLRLDGTVLSPHALREAACDFPLRLDLDRLYAACPIDEGGWKRGP